MYIIYKLTSPENKIYIGMTKQKKAYKRWQYGSGYVRNKPLYEDITNFGWENFKHEIVEQVETKEEATFKERELILYYKSNDPNYGYNKNTNESSVVKKKTYIRCIETGELFENMVAAGLAYGVSNEAIRKAIKTGQRSARKHWEKILL